MFAYCLNNPVNYSDEDGDRSDSIWGWIGEEIGELIYEWITGEDHPNDQVEALENQIRSDRVQKFVDGAKTLWKAYVHSVELQVQEQYQQHMETKAFIIDRFSTSQKRSNTYGVIGTTFVLGAEIGTAISYYGAYATATTAAAATAATGGLVIAIVAVVGTSFLLAQQIENVMAEDGG